MKICCISDLHGFLPSIPDCDLLLIAGDILPLRFQHNIQLSKSWLNTNFRAWLKEITRRNIKIIGIAGNHDFIFELYPELLPHNLDWNYLQDNDIVCGGLKIWGTPWQPYFHGWAFNLYEEDLCKKWELIPKDVDIILVHGPPYKHGDQVSISGKFIENVGSIGLLKIIQQIKPKLVVCGHIHGGYGEYNIGETKVINCSILNERYQFVNSPILITG